MHTVNPHRFGGGGGVGTNPTNANLIHWFSMDDTAGPIDDAHSASTAAESGAGTATYEVTAPDAGLGTAITCDGAIGWIDGADDETDTYPFSICGWFKMPAASIRVVVNGCSDESQPDRYHLIGLDATGLATLFSNNDSSEVAESSSAEYDDDTWHYMTGVWASNTQRELYIDGADEALAVGTSVAPNAQIQQWNLGFWIKNGPDGRYWEGELDELSMWSDALSLDEHIWLYQDGAGKAYSDL